MTLAHYLRYRTRYEVLAFIALISLGCVFNVAVELIDQERTGEPFSTRLPWLLEITSNLALLVMMPALLWFDRRFPLSIASWGRNFAAHLMFSVAFSFGHVLLMYLARQAIFPALLGSNYHWDDWLGEFSYEYLKDVRSYFYFLAFIYLYRFMLLRLRGEAGFVGAGDAPEATPTLDRFLVKKFGREFLVRTEDIDWIESAGNYVNLHVKDKVYPLRGTMAQTTERLASQGFARVHRQAIVNLERVAQIEVFDSGDGQLTLTTDATVAVSRRYRAALRENLVPDSRTD